MLTEGVVDTEVQTTVDDDTDDGGDEATANSGWPLRLQLNPSNKNQSGPFIL